MKEHIFFDEKLLKQLKRTHKSHTEYTEDNSALKDLFRKNINRPTLGTMVEVICKYGYDDEKDSVRKFQNKVNSGNYDDNDIEIFKGIIEEYQTQIMEALEQGINTEMTKLEDE